MHLKNLLFHAKFPVVKGQIFIGGGGDTQINTGNEGNEDQGGMILKLENISPTSFLLCLHVFEHLNQQHHITYALDYGMFGFNGLLLESIHMCAKAIKSLDPNSNKHGFTWTQPEGISENWN